MKNSAKGNHPFIYDRTTGEKIPVSKEVRGTYYGEADRIRMKEQAYGRRVCPQSKVWACDGNCLICAYRRSGGLASLDVPIGEDGGDTLMDMVPSEAPAIERIIADRDLLDRLFARLRELAPDADAIIARWMNGGNVSDRTIAKAPAYLRRPDEEVSDGVPAHPGLLIRSTPGPLTIGFTVAGGPLLFF